VQKYSLEEGVRFGLLVCRLGLRRFGFYCRSLSSSGLLAKEFCMTLFFRLGSGLVPLCPGALEVFHLLLLLLGGLLRLGEEVMSEGLGALLEFFPESLRFLLVVA
jgi:hypothetical protein